MRERFPFCERTSAQASNASAEDLSEQKGTAHNKKRAGPPKEAGPHKAVWNGQDNRLPYSEKQFAVGRERPVLGCGLKLELVAVCTERVHCRDHFIFDLVCKYFVIIDRI